MTRTERRTRHGEKRPAADRSRGFTLVELITVLLIMGIMSVFIFSNFGGTSPAAGARASELRAQLRFLQLRAMKGGAYCGLSCDGTNYWAFSGTDPAAVAARIALPGETSSLVTLVSKDMAVTPAFTVYFDGMGIPYSGATPVKLAAALTITITSAGQPATLSVAPETGFVP